MIDWSRVAAQVLEHLKQEQRTKSRWKTLLVGESIRAICSGILIRITSLQTHLKRCLCRSAGMADQMTGEQLNFKSPL